MRTYLVKLWIYNKGEEEYPFTAGSVAQAAQMGELILKDKDGRVSGVREG